jgi:outer membrane usher protein FimD/PapC
MSRRRCALPRLLGRLTLLSTLLAPAVARCAVAEQGSPNPPVQLAAAVPRASDAAVELVVDVLLNGERRGDFFLLREAAGGLLLKRDDAVALGLRFPEDRRLSYQGQQYVPLDALEEVSVAFDEKKLTLTILGKTVAAGRTVIDTARAETGRRNAYVPEETSAFFNYALTSSKSDLDDASSFTGTGRFGLRWGEAFFLTDARYARSEGDGEFTRLMSSLTFERPDDLQRLVVGDQFARSGSLGSTLNIGGVGFSKVYALDPYLSTRPRLSLGGETVFPSDAEIYLDGRRIGEYHLPAGEFELQNISAYGGAHTIEVLLRDPFGNERRLRFPGYFSDALLRAGLHEYRYNAGFLREQYGAESNEYGDPVFSAFHRYGVTDALNVGAQAEGGDEVVEGGVQVATLVPRLGQLTLDAAASTGDAGQGWSGALRHAYQQGGFGVNFFLRGTTPDFATVGMKGDAGDRTKVEAGAGLGYSTRRWGGVSLGWSGTRRHSGDENRTSWATYTWDFTSRSTFFLTARLVDETERDFQLALGCTWRLRKDTRVMANFDRTDDTSRETLQVQQNVPRGEGLGYRVFLGSEQDGDGDEYSLNASLQYNARYGTLIFTPHVESQDGERTEGYDVTAAGSLVFAGGFFGASRPVDESFAFVMADHLGDTAVQVNGEDLGRTAASGRLVVPNLAPYHVNEIGLDGTDLPIDLSVTEMKLKLLPPQWSGSCVSFDVVPLRAVFGTLVLARGALKTPLEHREMTVRVGERDVTATVAKGGEFYLENLLPERPEAGAPDPKSCRGIAARLAAGSPVIKPGTYRGRVSGVACEFELTFPDTAEVMTDLGEIVCSVPETLGPAGNGAPPPVAVAQPAPDRSFEKTLPEAFAALLGLWRLDALADEVRHWSIYNFKEKLLAAYFEETGLSSTHGMEFLLRPATLDNLREVNLPCLALASGGPRGQQYVVFAGFERDRAVLIEPGGARREVPAAAWVSSVKGSLVFLVPKAGTPGAGGPGARP